MALTRRERIRGALAEADAGKAMLSVLLALTTVVTSVVVALQFDASAASAAAERRADAAALQRSEADARGAGDQIVDYGMYRAWFEQAVRANWAAERAGALGLTDPSMTQLLVALNQTDTALADWVRANSPLLQPPFFDAATNSADFIGYLADRATAGIRAGERFDTANAEASGHEGRAAAFVALLTVLAAALFFLGLAATVDGRPRAVLGVAGLLFAAVGTLGSVVIALQPVHRVSDAAIEAVVRATAEEIQGAPRGTLVPTEGQRRHALAAIAAAQEAVRLDPAYPGAWRVQGESNLLYATALYFSTEHPDVSAYVSRAIEGYDRVLASGRYDFSVPWNLGWAKYMAGDLEGSLTATSTAFGLTPDRFTLYLNRALVELARGDPEGAKASVETGLDVAARAGLGSHGTFFAETDFELGRLAELRPAEAETLRAIRRRVREAEASIASTGQARPAAPKGSVRIESLAVLSLQQDATLRPGAEIAEGGTMVGPTSAGFRLMPAVDGAEGGSLVVRVRRDGLVDHGYSRQLTLGSAAAPLDLVAPYGRAGFGVNPGTYEIELYLGGYLAATRTLTVTGS